MALSAEELQALRHVAEHTEPQQIADHIVRYVVENFHGRVAVISSFGAESAVLLAKVAVCDAATPIFFLDTKRHFPETLAYQETLSRALNLRDVRVLSPDSEALRRRDPQTQLAAFDSDACCALRKVEPLDVVLPEFDIWMTGRKRSQASTRASLPIVEVQENGSVKLNPLAGWSRDQISVFMEEQHLPAHPLVAQGYRSIGCAPCTRAVGENEDDRAGRWTGQTKIECGIHRPAASSTH